MRFFHYLNKMEKVNHNFTSPSRAGRPSKIEENPLAQLKIFEFIEDNKKTPSLGSFFGSDTLLFGEINSQKRQYYRRFYYSLKDLKQNSPGLYWSRRAEAVLKKKSFNYSINNHFIK